MGKPGAKKMDQIVSVTPGDVHIIMIPSPGGPVPTPIPHPCASMIKDKVAKKVKVMGQPGAVKGSKSKHTPPHIPMGPGPFQKPPKNEGEIITGSSSVFYEGKEAAMLGDTGKMCSDPSDTPVGKVIGTAAMVLVGGGSSGGDAERAQASAAAMKAAAAACHKWISANMPPGAEREKAHRDVCSATGHPIDVVTGKLFTKNIDLQLPGRIPFEFARNYSSARSDVGAFGRSWRHSYEAQLIIHREFVAHRDHNGRFLEFEPVAVGASSYNKLARVTLHRSPVGYILEHADELKEFFPWNGQPTDAAVAVPIRQILDRYDNHITFEYTNDRLTRIIDSAGRIILLDYNDRGFIHTMRLIPDPIIQVPELVRTYIYSIEDDLIAVQDEAGQSLRFSYANHLLVQETNRMGFSFYFAFDKEGWCRETWGDGGIFYRSITYDRGNKRTRVINSLGQVTIYEWNASGVVETEINHLGHTWRFEFDESLQRIRTEDPVGSVWSTEYDEEGRVVAMQSPEGATIANKFSPDGTLVHTDALGQTWKQETNAAKREIQITGPLGGVRTKLRDAKGNVVTVRYNDGKETNFTYDHRGDAVSIQIPSGLRLIRRYSDRGWLLSESDQLGLRLSFEYDKQGNPIKRWDRRRGEAQLGWDAQGRLTRVVDAKGRTTDYEYGHFNRLVAIHRPLVHLADGSNFRPVKRFEYDSENRLTAVISPGGEATRLFYEDRGRPMRIEYPDGRVQCFERNERDFITAFYESGLKVFSQSVDSEGRVLHRVTGEGDSFSFEYDSMGNLLVADTTHAEDTPVRFEYDALNRVTVEEGEGGCQQFQYLRGREHILSRWDDDLTLDYRISASSTGPTWTAALDSQSAIQVGFDLRMRMTQAFFGNGERQQFRYERLDQPITRTVSNVYGNVTEDDFEYDEEGWLVSQKRSAGEVRRFFRDELNRLVGQADKTDGTLKQRKWGFDRCGNRTDAVSAAGLGVVNRYAAGNRIATLAGQPVSYDRQGRVKFLPTDDGGLLTLDWDLLGRLRKVTLPGGGTVSMRYDALGRRVAKITEEGITKFGWVGNRMVHERRPDGEERHYIYYGRSHKPLTCLIRKPSDSWKVHSFVTDSRSAAVEMTNETGKVVWTDRADPWGVRDKEPEAFDQPITLAGHYRDKETGLHYNYARYYAPLGACYLAPDPIGLEGGDNPYGYVADPSCWSDPLGLNGDDECGGAKRDPTKYNYRGVSANHPQIEAARRGECIPGDVNGTVTPEEHNAGGVADKSPYTSWTVGDIEYARTQANKDGPGGVILAVPQGAPKEGDSWSWEWSPDEYHENEVLLKGRRDGCEVLDP